MFENIEKTEAPKYVLPLFFTTKTQEIFSCKADEEVTEEEPYKIILKQNILQDFRDRAAISDFHPAKKIVENYPAEELLVVYDPAFKYGQNFYLVTDEEQKQALLQPPTNEDVVLEEMDGDVEIEIPYFGLRTPKPWLSLGSEVEVAEERVTQQQQKIQFTITRERHEFGCLINFDDRIEDELKDVAVDCFSFEDLSYNVVKKELDVGVQNTIVLCDQESQTEWPWPKNANVQYVSRSNTEEENEVLMASNDIMEFIVEVTPRFELALQQNETLDVFVNDYLNLGEEESGFGTKSDNHLKEYQSFTDLQFSKNKTISDIQWHPHIKGVIAVSCIQQMSFYERIDQSSKVLMTPALILIWSFADPIHPLLLLEAPDDILCFKFNPSDPNIICGGCINGQIILWDIKKYNDLLKNHRTHGQGSDTNRNMTNLASFYQNPDSEMSSMVRYCAVSSIEHSHRMAITDIQWIPDHFEIGRMGVVLENKSRFCCQIMTCSSDGNILFWDTKPTKSGSSKPRSALKPTSASNDFNRISTFKHLDLTWKPLLKVTTHRVRGSGEYSPVRFNLDEIQSTVKRTDLPARIFDEEEQKEPENQFSGMTSFKKKEEGKQLDNINTKFYVATEDGEIVYLDWKPTKDIDTGKIVSARPEFCLDAHDSIIHTLQRSPFSKDIMLSVGAWTFSIWKDGLTFGPLFQSYAHGCKLMCGHWSPSRPGVFFIGKSDGNIDVWDLLDKSHEPYLTQNVSPVPIVTVYPSQMSNKLQLLAAGDEMGTLHVMEVPWNLKHVSSNEQSIFENYLEREANRLQHLEEHGFQVPAKMSLKLMEDKEQVEQLNEEWEEKAKEQYSEYLEMEKRLLIDMGILAEVME